MADLDGGYLVSQRHYKGFGTCVHTKRSVGIASVNTLAAYQSLKLDCTGILVVKICVFKVCDNDKNTLLFVLSCHLHVLLKLFSRYSQD